MNEELKKFLIKNGLELQCGYHTGLDDKPKKGHFVQVYIVDGDIRTPISSVACIYNHTIFWDEFVTEDFKSYILAFQEEIRAFGERKHQEQKAFQNENE